MQRFGFRCGGNGRSGRSAAWCALNVHSPLGSRGRVNTAKQRRRGLFQGLGGRIPIPRESAISMSVKIRRVTKRDPRPIGLPQTQPHCFRFIEIPEFVRCRNRHGGGRRATRAKAHFGPLGQFRLRRRVSPRSDPHHTNQDELGRLAAC